MKIAAALCVLGLAACSYPRAVQRTATAHYDTTHRDVAWSRALRALQARGYVVAISDRAGGTLATQPVTTSDGCGLATCYQRDTVQIMITEEGTVSVHLLREVQVVDYYGPHGWRLPDYAPAVQLIEDEQDAILQAILRGP